MNRKQKRHFRLLALVFSFMMLVTCLSVPAFAAEGQTDNNGAAVTTDEVNELTDMVIDDSELGNVSNGGEAAADGNEELGDADQDENIDPEEGDMDEDDIIPEPEPEQEKPAPVDPPAQVKGFGLSWNGSTIILTWKKTAGADGYEIWRSKEKPGAKNYVKAATYSKSTSVKFYDRNMVKSRIYFYKVRAFAVNAEGKKVYGPYSVIKKSGKTATRIPVATYHHFCKASEFGRIGSYSSLYVTDKAFAAQMSWLKKNGWRTITTDEMADWHAGKIELPYKSTLITFDDGCMSVIKYALPVMKKYNIKGTSFIQGNMVKTTTSTKPKSGYKDYYFGKDVIKKVKKTYPNLEFQSHTWRMHDKMKGKAPVTVMTYTQIKADATRMKKTFGTTAVAYPWGAQNKKTRNALKAAGYKTAYTFRDDGYATRTQNAFKLKRFKVYGGKSLSSFTKWYK